MRHRLSVAALLALSALAPLAPALAGPPIPDDPRIDRQTGRQKATWPKDRLFDHLHMKLELDIPDINKPYLEAVETITVAPIGVPRSAVTLDCQGPKVQSVTLNGSACTFEQPGKKLTITFPGQVGVGVKGVLVIKYTLDFPNGKGEGLTFSPGKPESKGITTQFTQIHAQGEAEMNSKWFPCLDHPSEKLTSELVVTVEEGYEVVSNGYLAAKTPVSGSAGRTRWHWVQDKPHSTYLVTLVVGKLAVVELGGPDSARPGLSIPVYTPFGTEENVKVSYGGTPEMIAFFEKRFGVAYPWDKYAQCMVRDFAAGGMENTSCTLMTVRTASVKDRGQDDLVSHELGHQWFGDLVTCRSWDHLWLNEGWATYCEALWAEHEGEATSPERARANYLRKVSGFARQQRSRNHGSLPESAAIVSNRFTDPDAVFMKADDPYSKGGVILHMLRERLGDETFFSAVKAYLERYSYKTAETDDFRRVLEEFSGQSLERFFNQWCDRPGMARLSVDEAWDEGTSTLTVSVEQTQTIDRLNPAYAVSVPVLIRLGKDDDRWAYIDMDTRSGSVAVKLPAKPESVSIDPNITILAGITVNKELSMWMDDALHAPTLAARLDALEHVVRADPSRAVTHLMKIAAGSGDPEVRAAAGEPLAAFVAFELMSLAL